ncbi:MAG: choice-of-anchor J domain-containing protein [Flavobacteriaceae bacterium]|nr:choice-of-anchor J domain-containing protein [Flavobacteriaceae bacterium]
MITTKFYNIVITFLLIITLFSCVQDDDFTIPDVTITEPKIIATSSITAIQAGLNQEFTSNQKLIYRFRENEEPTYLIGYVISSDKTGSFYKKLIVQDDFENPTAGIEILVDKTSLSETFEFGRKVYVKLDGLSISYDDGEIDIDPTNAIGGKFTLGIDNGNGRVETISATSYTNHLVRSSIVANIIPLEISIADFNQKNSNTYVKLNNIQFQKSEAGKTYSAEANDEFDGLRILISCETSNSIKLQTSTFSSFNVQTVPSEKGSLEAVVTKDYRAENYVLIINTPSDFNFTENRCDPLFEEYFESTIAGPISLLGWTNFKEAGSLNWESYYDSYSLGKSARMGAYRSGDTSNIAWLISPGFDFDAQENEILSFKTSNSFADSSTLEVFISTDWDATEATITTANWTLLPATIVPNSASYKDWISSGNIDLSSYTGIGYIAFKYTGSSTSSKDGTYELDDIVIKKNE